MARLLLFFFFAFLSVTTPSFCQDKTATTTPVSVSEPQVIDVAQIKKELSKIEIDVSKGKLPKKDVSERIKMLSTLHDNLIIVKTQDNSDLTTIQKKIAALGPVPENGEKEPADLAKQRKEFNKQADDVKAKIANSDLALAKIDELNQLILKTRNQELFDKILIKRNSILDVKEFGKSLSNFAVFLYQLCKYPADWYQALTIEQQSQVKDQLMGLGFWSSLGLLVAIGISLFIRKKFGYKIQINNPNYSQKVMAALFMILARGAVPAAIAGAFVAWLYRHKTLFSGPFGDLLVIAGLYLLYLFLFCAIVSVLFTPNKPKWRLIEVSDERAKSLNSALIFSIIIICIFSFFQVLAVKQEYSEDIIYALKTLANGVKAFCTILVAHRFLYNNSALTDEELEGDDIQGLSTSSKLSILISLIALVVFGFSLIGYIRLAEFIFNRLFASVLIISCGYIIQKLFVVMFHQLMMRRFWTTKLRINKQGIGKIEFWFSFMITPIIFAFGTLTVLAFWDVSVDIMLQNIKKFLTGFDIGGMRISIISIILGIISFFVTLFILKIIKNSLLTGNLSKIDMDAGIRNSLAAGLGFFGMIAGVFIAISVMGGSFKGLAIVAGALSFGAGLGLQNVVNNFVSGLILLFERPVKIGDWVIINGHEGIVKQISMRSTQLETFNKANVIIPNADLLSNSLINMTYKSKTARIDIPIGVGYDSNVSQVETILLEIAKGTKNVLSNPSPFVIFLALGESSLNFQLSCYTSDVNNKRFILTSILETVITRFREENIEIPFPQRVVHLNTISEKQSVTPQSNIDQQEETDSPSEESVLEKHVEKEKETDKKRKKNKEG